MHYVKHFDILGVNTAQIPCIELQGVPNSATEGAVGLLGMNVLSKDHEVYLCVEVNGSVYTWIPLKDGKDGVCIVKTELNDKGELIITLSNGTVNNLGVIKGEKGDPGEKGEQADLTKIKEKNKGRHLSVWFGSKNAFENLSATEENTAYIFEDDDTLEKIDAEFDKINNSIEILNDDVNTLKNDMPTICEVVREAESTVGTMDNRVKVVESGLQAVVDGTTVVGKSYYAEKDEDGNNIVRTYATKESVDLPYLTYTVGNLSSDNKVMTDLKVSDNFSNIFTKLLIKTLVITSDTSFLSTVSNKTVSILMFNGGYSENVSCSWSYNGNLGYGTITFNI